MDARTAAALADARRRHIVLQLVVAEQSLSGLAAITGMSLSLLHYHVVRLLALGLIGIARQEHRSGRPVKYYRAVARTFFVPAHVAGRSPGETLLAELLASLDQSRARDPHEGIRYFIDDQMNPRMQRTGGEAGATRSAEEVWSIIHLDEQQLKAVGNEIRALLSQYAGPGHSRARPYLGYCVFAPRR